jgi:hypothetical protein
MLIEKIENQSEKISCPICGGLNIQNEARVSYINLKFMADCLAKGTLDEAISILRLIVEKVPGITLDISNKSAMQEYFEKMQEQIARTVVNPIALLTENADRLLNRLSELTAKVPLDIKSQFIEVNHELTEKLRTIEKNSTEAPLVMFNGTLNPLMEKLGMLIEKLPKDIQQEFRQTRIDLQEKLAEIKITAEKSTVTVGCEVKELRDSLNTLINKPAALGRLGESILAEVWKSEFAQDVFEPKGGAGEPDALLIPYLEMRGGDYGKKVSIERKTGKQAYLGRHLEETCRHAKKYGANQAMLIYDNKTNLPETFYPMKVVFRPQQKLTIMIVSLEERAWVTARQILEVFQLLEPNEEPKHAVNLIQLKNTIADIQNINSTIDKLRKSNNAALRNCDSTRTYIDDLEELILNYQLRLKNTIKTDEKKVSNTECE